MFQQTIKKRVEVTGIGLHSGEPVKVVLEPLNVDSGIIFVHAKSGVKLRLNPKNISDTKLATVIGKKPNAISTIEHFLSALYAYAIDNLKVIVYGNEMPVMDGSAISFCMLLDEAGIKKQNKLKSVLVIKEEVRVEENGKIALLKPSKKPVFKFKIAFNHPVIGEQEFSFNFSKKRYIEEIARARTFGFARDIQYLQSINLALGASLENAIGLDDTSVLNPEGLRYENEFVRHKILDAIGDLMLVGHQVVGEYVAVAASHDINNKLTRKLLESTNAYEIIKFEDYESSKELVKAFA